MATHSTPEEGTVPPTDPGPGRAELGSTQIDTQADAPTDTHPVPDDGSPGRHVAASTADAGQVSAAERAGPAAARAADFGIDTTTKTTSEAIRAYVQNLRNGELGALPALLGLLALFVLFTVLDTGGTFPSLINLANLLQQGAARSISPMSRTNTSPMAMTVCPAPCCSRLARFSRLGKVPPVSSTVKTMNSASRPSSAGSEPSSPLRRFCV